MILINRVPMKMMDGACPRACAKRSRTRLGPTPTNISMKSDPEIDRNGTPDSPAVALARSVFPVPGGPTRRAPRGIFAPRSSYFFGRLRKSTNSMISAFASSQPATSMLLLLIQKTRKVSIFVLKVWSLSKEKGRTFEHYFLRVAVQR